jgi:predicted ATP-dependent serine protease
MKNINEKSAGISTINNDLGDDETKMSSSRKPCLSLVSKAAQGKGLRNNKVKDGQQGGEAEGEAIPAQTLIKAQDILSAEIPETKYAFPGLIPQGLTILAGKPKMGKSWFCLNLAASIAYGFDFLDQTPGKREVLYFALEDSPTRIKQRLSAILPEGFKVEDDNV